MGWRWPFKALATAAVSVALWDSLANFYRGRLVPRGGVTKRLLELGTVALAAVPPHGTVATPSPPMRGPAVDLATALEEALDRAEALGAEVRRGHLVPKFGEQVQDVIEAAVARMGGGAQPELEHALDSALHALFLQQLALLRQQLTSKFERFRGSRTAALSRADREFVNKAQALVRPGSDWSFEPDRALLSADLKSLLAREAALAQLRIRAERTRRATVDVVGKLQDQMEKFGEMLHGPGGGSPVVFWTSYRFPGTPVQVSGRYRQGRANIEFNLLPDVDPATAEAGFVSGVTSRNLGVSLNVGI